MGHYRFIEMETITIPKQEYEMLKKQANIDVELLMQFLESFKDIKEGRVKSWND